ncbi:ABC transporter ATP-binding protein [Aerococcaceae bacterium DSM 111020]|nr:ABC transporter ATP-binding protein [Aerococcaceae bacterium DSM 111020]
MAQQKKNAKAKNFWGTIGRLIRYMSNRAWWMLLVLVLAAISAFFSAQLPRVMGRITTIIYEGLSQGFDQSTGRFPIDFAQVRSTVMILAGVYVFAALTRYAQQFITARISQHTVYDLRKNMNAKMGKLPISYFDSHSNGDILSRAINDMDQVANSLGQTLTQVTTSIVQFITVLITMLTMSGPLAFVVILMIPLSLIAIRLIAPKSQEQFNYRQQHIGHLNDFTEEAYSGHSILRVYNQEETAQAIFDQRSDDVNEAAYKAEFYTGLMNPVMGAIKDIIYLVVATFGGIGVLQGKIEIGVVQSFLQYTNQFASPFRMLANIANTINITVAATERVFEVIDEPNMENPDGLETKSDSPYIVEFDHVQFGYGDGLDDLLMTDFNLQVREGEMIAIVGPTGAGKTTLINLLERFYDVKGGAVRVNGVDVRNIDREVLREKMSMVLQDTWLFHGTIWDNIRYGVWDVTDEEILEASKAAHVHDFVTTLPDGYDTILVEDGVNLSQGQRQLITIARAFLQDPKILILDEATSSVDTRTEVMIQRAMSRLLENRTSFVVAHRLSTIRDADKIVVMDQGNVVEQGSHDALLEADGFYANLYNAQFA